MKIEHVEPDPSDSTDQGGNATGIPDETPGQMSPVDAGQVYRQARRHQAAVTSSSYDVEAGLNRLADWMSRDSYGVADEDVASGPSGRSFWDLLPHEDRRVLASLGREREYPPGASLCAEGDPVTHVFVLLDGWVKVMSVTPDGRESVLALRGAGDVVGETAGETTGVRNATMQAMVTVRALIVEYERFSSFLDTHQGGNRAYRRVIVHRWRDAEAMLRARAVTSGAQRLAQLLIALAEELGGQPEGVIEIALPLSQDELASLAGTSRATVARALNAWRKRGLIRTGQHHIILTDVPGLRRAAGQRLARHPGRQPQRMLRQPRTVLIRLLCSPGFAGVLSASLHSSRPLEPAEDAVPGFT